MPTKRQLPSLIEQLPSRQRYEERNTKKSPVIETNPYLVYAKLCSDNMKASQNLLKKIETTISESLNTIYSDDEEFDPLINNSFSPGSFPSILVYGLSPTNNQVLSRNSETVISFSREEWRRRSTLLSGSPIENNPKELMEVVEPCESVMPVIYEKSKANIKSKIEVLFPREQTSSSEVENITYQSNSLQN